MTLVVSHPDYAAVTVTSERAARGVARRWLGVGRVYETPTETGWQLWPSRGADDSAAPVTVTVV